MDSRYLDIVRLLIDAAPFVFTQQCFALKGGTAINLFVEDMPRLSVDIDLVFTDLTCPDRDSALAAIEHTLHDVATPLHSKLGVTPRLHSLNYTGRIAPDCSGMVAGFVRNTHVRRYKKKKGSQNISVSPCKFSLATLCERTKN